MTKLSKSFGLMMILSLLTLSQIKAQRHKVDVQDFDKISFGTSGIIHVTQGNTTSVEVETSDERWEKLTVEVRSGRLVINQKGWGIGTMSGKLEVYVTTPDIHGLEVSGSGNMKVENKIDTRDLDMAVSGSGRITLEAAAHDIKCRISGSGSIELSGKSNSVDCHISGSGNLKGEDMSTQILDAQISGSGGCSMDVEQEITAHISGSGNVRYSGNPSKVDSHTSGSGRVKKI